jgi:hypothetical protein
VSWDGDSALIPFLPGVAFDQYFPNLRMVPREGTMLYAKDAQQTQLAEFEDWVHKAQQRFDHEQTCPMFGTLALAAVSRQPVPRRISREPSPLIRRRALDRLPTYQTPDPASAHRGGCRTTRRQSGVVGR